LPESSEHPEHHDPPAGDPAYEAPSVEDLDAPDGPAVTAAGATLS
jgi:hypothetical protein